MSLSRRDLLTALVFGLAGGATAACGTSKQDLLDFGARLRHLVATLPTEAASLGRRYRRQGSAGTEAEDLLEEILSDLRAASLKGVRGGTEERLAMSLADLVRRDFAQGHTVELGGWVLARTEARLYALAAASSP